MSAQLNCFKAYDIRGRVPEDLNEEIAYRIGRAYVEFTGARRVVIGRDVRPSSETLCAALASGLTEGGASVVDIGLCGTEEMYFATFDMGVDGGIVVTASHNPSNYNGMKLVREGARPISADTGLRQIHDLVAEGRFSSSPPHGSITTVDNRERYVHHLLGYVDREALSPLRIVTNAGNGGAGPVVDQLEPHLPFELVKINHQPDGSFPNGIPNPLLPERREATIDAMRDSSADLGLAWDGDFDRCFFFDEQARFIEGYYIVGMLAEAMLRDHPGEAVVYDPRLVWNTIDQVQRAGGRPIQCKSGHAFMKQRMREVDGLYGGEMSAHHYFRDFAYCDSGMIPWLLLAAEVSRAGRALSDLVSERIAAYPCSGEINFQVDDVDAKIAEILDRYCTGEDVAIDRMDGIGVSFAEWRFNLRASNTEPLLRLNVEARGNRTLMEYRTEELRGLIEA